MTSKGRLNVMKSGYNMPLDAPLYAKPPIYYRHTEAISFTYETDKDAVLDILPEGLEMAEPALATVLFIRYPFSTLGPYEEVILSVPCLLDGQPKSYIPHIVVNSDIPFAAGREIWGYPKKFAHITLEKDGDIMVGTMERPKGNRICTGWMRPETPAPPPPTTAPTAGLSLRVIPAPDGSTKPSLAELIEVPPEGTTLDAWIGPGSLQFNSTSDLDPWHRLGVKKLLVAAYRHYNSVLHLGKVVKRY